MRASVRQNLILAFVMVVGSVVLWIASLDLKPQSAFFPRLLLAIIIGCALVIAGEQVMTMRRSRPTDSTVGADAEGPTVAETDRSADENESAEGRGTARQWLIAVALVAYVVAFTYVGPYVATFLLMAGLYVLLSRDRTWKSAVSGALLAAALTVLLYGLFGLGLNVSMPAGLLI